MKVWIIRHGETEYNKERRYQGKRDISLSEQGRERLAACSEKVDKVYVSNLKRTAQTAEIIFPGGPQIPVEGLAEMGFGVFEGRCAQEMEQDEDYQRWIDSGGNAEIPGGESKAAFSQRIIQTMNGILWDALEAGEERIVMVVHGGTIMASMERLGTPKGKYFEWLPQNGAGYELEVLPREELSEAEGEHRSIDDLTCRIVRNISFCVGKSDVPPLFGKTL